MKISTRKLTSASMLCAAAYLLMLISKIIPQVYGFLQFDVKDVAITIGGFVLGPVYAVIISLVVGFLEFLSVSDTGIIGLIMNFVSTASYCATASLIYNRKRTLNSAIAGLCVATLVLTGVMVLWNYYITPLYMVGTTREMIAPMLATVFLPFNLVKGLLNTAIILITYRPIVGGLRRAKLVEMSASAQPKKKFSPAIVIGVALLLICIPVILAMIGLI